MRILLDECVPRRLTRYLPGHTTESVTSVGWAGLRNGDLIRRAAGAYEAFITVDQRFIETASTAEIIISTLRARSNRIEDLRLIAPAIMTALDAARRGDRLTLHR